MPNNYNDDGASSVDYLPSLGPDRVAGSIQNMNSNPYNLGKLDFASNNSKMKIIESKYDNLRINNEKHRQNLKNSNAR